MPSHLPYSGRGVSVGSGSRTRTYVYPAYETGLEPSPVTPLLRIMSMDVNLVAVLVLLTLNWLTFAAGM